MSDPLRSYERDPELEKHGDELIYLIQVLETQQNREALRAINIILDTSPTQERRTVILRALSEARAAVENPPN